MASNGSTIRVALDLVAQTSGLSALSGLTYALSSLASVSSPLTDSVDLVSAALRRQDLAAQGLATALDRQDSAARRVAISQLQQDAAGQRVAQALAKQQNAADDLSTAEANLNGLIQGQGYLYTDQELKTIAAAQAKVTLAQRSKDVADAQVQEAQTAEQVATIRVQEAQAIENVAAAHTLDAQAAYDAATANIADAQAASEAAAAQQAAADTLNGYMAVLVAAGIEALGFDAALKAIVTDASQLQYTTQQMDLSLHGTADQIAQLNPAIIQWADNSLYTTAQVHQLVQALSEHGLDVSSILNGDGQAAITLGEAIGGQPVDAANLLGSVLQQFSSQGLTATDATNTLTATFYNGISSASELQQAYDQVGGQAAAMGVSFKDLSTTLDLLAQAGLSGSTAASGLRYMLQTLDDPTNKAATDMNFLGLTVVNQTSPAFEQLKQKLDAAGLVGQAVVSQFDGTSVGLNNMFKEAQKLNLLPLNQTFNEWAMSSGAMSSKLFDSKGNFIGLQGSLEQLFAAVQAKSGGNKEVMAQLLGDMFNVRSGKDANLLANMTDFSGHYARVTAEMNKPNQAANDAAAMKGTLQGSWQQFTTTLTSFGSAIGKALLPPLTALVQWFNTLVSHIMSVNPAILKGVGLFLLIGAVIATVVVVVLALVVVFGVVSTLVGGPVLAVFAGVALLIPIVAGVVAFLVTHWQQLWAVLSPWVGAIGKAVVQTFRDFESAIAPLNGRFAGLGQAFSRLWQALQPLMPFFFSLALALGSILALAIGLVIGLVMGLVNGVVMLATGIALFVTGVIQIFTGLWAFFLDLFALIAAWFQSLFSDHPQQAHDKMIQIMGRLGDDLHTIWDGIVNTTLGVITAGLGTVIAFIVGFCDGIIQFFLALYDALVGHSIIPDMVRAIWSWFEQLPARAVSAVQSLVTQVKNLFSGLLGDMGNFGANLVKMLAQGITGGIGSVVNAASNVALTIRNILGHHSPPPEGPLADDDTYMPNMMRMYAQGIATHTPLLASAMTNAANTSRFALTQGMAPQGLLLGGGSGSGAMGGNQSVTVQVGNQQLFTLMMNALTGQMQLNGLGRAFK